MRGIRGWKGDCVPVNGMIPETTLASDWRKRIRMSPAAALPAVASHSLALRATVPGMYTNGTTRSAQGA